MKPKYKLNLLSALLCIMALLGQAIPNIAHAQTNSAAEAPAKPEDDEKLSDIKKTLTNTIAEFRINDGDVRNVIEGIGRSYGLPVLLEPEVTGKVTFSIFNVDLRTLLDAICSPQGWSWEIEPAGYIIIRRFVVKNYRIDYLPVSQAGSSSASVNLTGGSSGGSGSSSGSGSGSSSGSSSGTGSGGSSGSGGAGSSSLSSSQTTETDFWARYADDIKSMLDKDETASINKFGGILQVKAGKRTHARIASYSSTLMQRVRRQVFVSVRIVRVDLNDTSKLGVDWNVAAFNAHSAYPSLNFGGDMPGTVTGSGGIKGKTDLTVAGATSLPANTFTGVIKMEGISAMVTALKQQGKVTTETKPEIATLNNVPAFVQISEDRTFYSQTNSTSFNQGSNGTNGTTPTTTTNFGERVVSFGNLLEIIPQISDNNEVQLSLQPSITDLRGTDTSPDGLSTSPRQGISRMRSIVTLKDGETYIMGGFMSKNQGSTSRKIPILGDIPYLGVIFRTDAKSDDKTELAVFVTVHVRQPDAAKADDVLCPTPGPALDKMKTPAAEKDITKATIDSSPIQDTPKPLTSFNASDLVPAKQESKQGAVNGGGV